MTDHVSSRISVAGDVRAESRARVSEQQRPARARPTAGLETPRLGSPQSSPSPFCASLLVIFWWFWLVLVVFGCLWLSLVVVVFSARVLLLASLVLFCSVHLLRSWQVNCVFHLFWFCSIVLGGGRLQKTKQVFRYHAESCKASSSCTLISHLLGES